MMGWHCCSTCHVSRTSSSSHRWLGAVLQVLLGSLLVATVQAAAGASVSKPGGAGHALLFRDHVLVMKDFKDFPRTALTFEAWLSTSDFCHAGTILSYAKDSKSADEAQRITDFNHFVIFDPRNLLVCHDYQYIDLIPDTRNESCHAGFTSAPGGSSKTASYVERDAAWHHLAVTWDSRAQGTVKVYMDGLLMATAVSHKTDPLVPNGALMIGGEQDCYGGCTDPGQGFHGRLDEVRLWRVARPQSDILRTMRWVTGLENERDLVAYWKFNEPDKDDGQFKAHEAAVDSSGRGNHLKLMNPPTAMDAFIPLPNDRGSLQPPLRTGLLQFRNNFAVTKNARGMPSGSFTLEMWARGAALDESRSSTTQRSANLFSYATQAMAGDGSEGGDGHSSSPTGFMDDALRLERVQHDYAPSWLEPAWATSTEGSLVLHINSNEHTDNTDTRAWIYFDTRWVDDQWHHIAATWDGDTGEAQLFFDGQPATPFWKSDAGMHESNPVTAGGVNPTLVAGSRRGSEGALALGQDQDCYGGCFSPSDAFFGDLAVVRVWGRVLGRDEVRRNMGREVPESTTSLSALYIFDSQGMGLSEAGLGTVVDRSPSGLNDLVLRSSAPLYTYSTAPLTFTDGRPVAPPTPGAGGYSLALNDKQVLLATGFADFPSDALTLEFWMWGVDTCRPGVPFSYAAGQYQDRDNAFLVFNYNSWGVSVMEDEGSIGDHLSGVSATDGNWHHIAVTWESSTGKVVLYDNGRAMWSVVRGKGARIPSGGTLVLGREQDCPGGCFDSAAGAAGRSSSVADQEYGPQDFFGVIEEMRLWKVVRTPSDIRASMAADDGLGPGGFSSPGVDPGHKDLVAYWKFDEGAGYTVRDVTGHGHDLYITQPPRWEVTRWLSTCGNAVVEGLEECDDGDLEDGDGCSSGCKIEPGWICQPLSPSICWRKDAPAPPHTPPGPAPTPGPTPQPTPTPTPAPAPPPTPAPLPTPDSGGGAAGGGSKGGSSKGRLAAVIIVSILGGVAVVGLGVAAFLHRATITDRVPKVAGALADGLLAVVPGTGGMRRAREGYSPGLSYDPLDAAHGYTPEFIAMSPAPTRRLAMPPPGAPGAYQSLVGSPAPGPHNSPREYSTPTRGFPARSPAGPPPASHGSSGTHGSSNGHEGTPSPYTPPRAPDPGSV